MASKRMAACLGTGHRLLAEFLKRFGCRLIDPAGIAERVERARRGRDWTGMSRWVAEEAPKWVNDMATLTFEVPLTSLGGANGLWFAHEVWMCQPSLFDYVELGGWGIIRLWWDGGRGAAPYIPPAGAAV